MANDSTTRATGTQHGESLDLQDSPLNTTSNAEQETSPKLKLLENHPGEALYLEAAALDKATAIDDEALLNMIENDIHHDVSSECNEEARSSKLTNQETSSTETREEKTPDNPYATPSTSRALNEASEGHMTLEENSENDQFTLFPNLPIEVRLKIWQCTFVKRHIDLDFHLAYRFIMRGEGTYKPVDRYIPDALSVNRESRHETLKHYTFIYFSEDLEIRQFPDFDIHHIGPGWVNPSLDVIFFSEPPAVLMKEAYDSWFEHIASCIYMGCFRQLEVRHVLWDEDMETQTEPYYPTTELWRLIEHIMGFQGLRSVVLMGHGFHGPANDQLEIIRKLTVEYLEMDKHHFDGCRVPVVKVRQHFDVETGGKASE